MKMPHSRRPLILAIAGSLLFLPTLAAAAETNADVVKIFGRDPGAKGANACFVRTYSDDHLKSHPQQNVTKMMTYVTKPAGEDYYVTTLRVYFRDLKKPFEVTGSCNPETAGKSGLGCGIDCDGGWIGVRPKDQSTIIIDIPEHARIYDPAEQAGTEDEPQNTDVPEKAHFGTDDKAFKLSRTELKDCLPLVFDKEVKKKVQSGEVKD
jgi:hypothetical protein